VKRTLVFAVIFWSVGAGLLVADWARSTPHNRFEEPPPWQLGQARVDGAGHCAAPLTK
jgi:hypothetical protein